MASKQEQEDDGVPKLTPKRGVHDTAIHIMREMNPGYLNPLPVIISGDDNETQTQRGNLETSITTTSFTESEYVASQSSFRDVTDDSDETSKTKHDTPSTITLQSNTKDKGEDSEGRSKFKHGSADSITSQLDDNCATGYTSLYAKSLHVFDDSEDVSNNSKLEDVKSVSFVDTSGTYEASDTVITPKRKASVKFKERVWSISKRTSPISKPERFKTIALKTLQFKSQQMKPKTLSRITVFKALNLRDDTSRPFQKFFVKTLQFVDKPTGSKRTQKKSLRFEDEPVDIGPEGLNILKPLQFFDSTESQNYTVAVCKPLQSGERNPDKFKPLQFFDNAEEGALKTRLTKPSEQSIVVKPLQFYETSTKFQSGCIEPVPGTSKDPPLSVKPILKPLQFYQTVMGPIHFSSARETSESSETSILSVKHLKNIASPQSLLSKTEIEAEYRSVVNPEKSLEDMKPVKLAVSIESDINQPLGVQGIESYPLAADSIKFLEPVKLPYFSSSESAETLEVSKLVQLLEDNSNPISAVAEKVSSTATESEVVEYPEIIITHETASLLNTYASREHSLKEISSGEQCSMEHVSAQNVAISRFSDALTPSPNLIIESSWQGNVIVGANSDDTSTSIIKKVTLNETVIDLSSLSIMSSRDEHEDENYNRYGTAIAGTSKGFSNIGIDIDEDEYKNITDSDVKEILLSDILKSETSGETMLLNMSTIMSLDQAKVVIDMPDNMPSFPDNEEASDIYQEMIQGFSKFRMSSSVMRIKDATTTSDDSAKIRKEKKRKKDKIKNTDKVHSPNVPGPKVPNPKAPVAVVKKKLLFRRKKRKNIYTKRRKNRLKDGKVSTFSYSHKTITEQYVHCGYSPPYTY